MLSANNQIEIPGFKTGFNVVKGGWILILLFDRGKYNFEYITIREI